MNEQKMLDRPELREKIARICWGNEHFKNYSTWEEAVKNNQGSVERSYKCADQILAFIPDIEEAKREERERIKKLLFKAWAESNYGELPTVMGLALRQALGEK